MSINLISSLGLILCMAPGILHSVELGFPLLARWIVNFVLPFFGLALPNGSKFLTRDEQLTMLDAALGSCPEEKKGAGAAYVFLMLFEQRQGALAFISVIAGAIYGLTLTVAERGPLHLLLGVMAVLFMLVNANHAGVPLLGHHPRKTRSGRNVGLVFAPFWGVAAALNWMAFSSGQ